MPGESDSLSDSLLVHVENTHAMDVWEYIVRSDRKSDQAEGYLHNRNNNSRRNIRQGLDLDGQKEA